MDLDRLTQIQKDSINYHTSEMSLMKREYEKARKEVQEHEDSRNQFKIQKHTTETSDH